MPKTVSVSMLRALKACSNQVELFRSTFGEEAEVNAENLAKAVEAGLDFKWLAEQTLGGAKLNAYREALATAWKAYREALATAWKAYREALAKDLKAYDEALATARKASREATATAWMNLYLLED